MDTAAAEERSDRLRAGYGEAGEGDHRRAVSRLCQVGLLSGILGSARRYIIFREQQRFNLDKWITMSRRLHLALGARFAEEGVLDEPSDVFFLTKAEIRGIA